MKKVKGNLLTLALNGEFDLIIHGCNCFCTMGAGIARSIKDTFPDAYQADLATSRGDKTKLGSYSQVEVVIAGNPLIIINAYTQYEFRGGGRKADYEAIRRVFASIKKDFAGKAIGYPAIGAGLAGGDWKIISSIIDKELSGEDHTFVEFAH